MKIVVVSDSHRHKNILEDIYQANRDAEFFIHCGDIELAPSQCSPWLVVKGNNDLGFDFPEQRLLVIEKLKFLIIHSHQFYYSYRTSNLIAKAVELDCDIVCYGHTHNPHIEKREGIWLVNPGSLYYNRNGEQLGYVIIELKEGKQIAIRQVKLLGS